MRRGLLTLGCFICLLLCSCSGNSYKLAKDYQTRDTFGYLVFVSESGKQYDNLWVNILRCATGHAHADDTRRK